MHSKTAMTGLTVNTFSINNMYIFVIFRVSIA